MWKKSALFIGRYLAIGIIVGTGFVLVDEIHWHYVGSDRLEAAQEIFQEFKEPYMASVESLLRRSEEKRSTSPCLDQTESSSELFRPTPYYVNGEIQGYRMYPGTDRAQFKALGLRPGDLVTEINGRPLTNSSVALELFEETLSGEPVQFSVLRGDELEEIAVQVH